MVADYRAGFIRVTGAAGRQRDRFSLNLVPDPTIRSIAMHRGRLQLLWKVALVDCGVFTQSRPVTEIDGSFR
jgi:hypothetical protein